MWQLPPGLKPEDILLYSRKSRSDDPLLTVEEVLANHEQMLDEWVERNLPGLGRIPEENRFREVVSGETIASRPKIQELLRKAESPRYKAVLCVDPQRLSRGDLEDIGRMVKLLRYSNTYVFTKSDLYDLRETRDREELERELKRGNEFLEYQKRIQQNGRILAVQNGRFIGNVAPYGFQKTTVKQGRKKCHTLEPHPEEAKVVKMIFEMYRDGIGMVRICDRLDGLGIPAPKGPSWSPETIPVILANEHYIGKVVWNKRSTVRKVEDGDIVLKRPRAEEYLVYEGLHDAIIDDDLWKAVQEIRGKIPRNNKHGNFTNPLAGLLYCSCDRSMTYRRYPDKEGKEKCRPRYICGHRKRTVCGSVAVDDIMEKVVEALREAIEEFEIRIEKGTDDSAVVHHQMVERMEKRLAELEALEVSQWEKYTLEGMPKHIFEQLNKKVLVEKEELQQSLCTAKATMPEPIDLQEKIVTFQAALDALLDPDAPVQEQNLLLKQCIDRIDYSRERIVVYDRSKKRQDTPIHLDIKLRV